MGLATTDASGLSEDSGLATVACGAVFGDGLALRAFGLAVAVLGLGEVGMTEGDGVGA